MHINNIHVFTMTIQKKLCYLDSFSKVIFARSAFNQSLLSLIFIFFKIKRSSTIIISLFRQILDLAMYFIYRLKELFSFIFVLIRIRLKNLNIVLILIENCGCGNKINHVGNDFIKSFKIILTIFLGIILCDTPKSNYKVNFYFKNEIKYILFNKIKFTINFGIKNN